MEKGIFENVDFERYRRWDAVNQSTLKALKISGKRARYLLDNPKEPTPSMRFGQLVHSAIFERETFREKYPIAPDVDRRTKEGKQAYQDFESSLEGHQTPITQDDFEKVEKIVLAVSQHEIAGKLLATLTLREVSLAWTDKDTKEPCKARLDGISNAFEAVIDLKTATDITPEKFTLQAYNLGYHIQAAFYLRGLRELGQPLKRFMFITVESAEPHDVVVYVARPEFIEAGELEVEWLLPQYAENKKTNKWGGIASTFLDLSIPSWAQVKESYGA